ncbi:MAG: PAS domain-containing sensor histidine kinase [Candidatus Thorarchaeota archaeon]|nr:MAG: PAS domain-containing sensor histidine kinase [Candidatus Thorarchaeota archaeon]
MSDDKPTRTPRTEDRYESILRMANDGIVVVRDARIAMVNPALLRILEYEEADLLGTDFSILLDPLTAYAFQEQTEDLKIGDTASSSFRLRMLTKNGRAVPVEMSTSQFAYEGRPATVSIVRDMTEQLKLEAAIEQSETRYRQLYQSSPIAYFTLSPRGVVLQVNRAATQLLGHSEESMIRRNIESFLPTDPDKFKPTRMAMSRILEGASVTGIEMQMRKADGTAIWVQVTAGPLEGGDGPRRIGFMAQDIHRRKLAEQRERLEVERTDLLVDVATHDLNSINQAILFAMGLIESQLEIPDSLASMIQEASWNVRRSARMIANMRSMISLRDQPPSKRETDLHSHLQAALQSVKSDFPWKKLIVKTNIDEGKFVIRGHEFIEHVLFNIVHNSAMHSEEEQVEIEVMAEANDSDRMVRIEISDKGPGIPDQLKEFVFKRTGRPDAQIVGRGLGLTLVDNIVRNLEGEIWVEDRVKGDSTKGVKFVCLLPIWRDTSDLPCGRETCIEFYRSHHCFWCDPMYDQLLRMMDEMDIASSILESINIDEPGAEKLEGELPELPLIRLCDVELTGFVQEHTLRKELVNMLGKPCYKGM